VATLLIADDHPLFREALRGAVARVLPEAVLKEADNVEKLYALVESEPDADLLLLDLNMPGAQGFSALVHLRGQFPQVPVVVISAREEASIMRQAIEYGASGFIPKSASLETITQALQEVLDGQVWLPPALATASVPTATDADLAVRIASLTPQQFRVLCMLGEGLLNKQIAWELGVSEATVKAHMTAIMRKLGASNRTQVLVMTSRLALEGAHPANAPLAS
jgi:DNA-binding NarL/FixJ family response regulator